MPAGRLKDLKQINGERAISSERRLSAKHDLHGGLLSMKTVSLFAGDLAGGGH